MGKVTKDPEMIEKSRYDKLVAYLKNIEGGEKREHIEQEFTKDMAKRFQHFEDVITADPEKLSKTEVMKVYTEMSQLIKSFPQLQESFEKQFNRLRRAQNRFSLFISKPENR